ncbi:thiol methyltransferase protein [Diplodia corticola]|uniref:Thiol methyltransferase protein n=1 Tax=Diplodia corticola TaxID=236234 RepID=A0A1J9RXU1_9PEZI|nr:thiol methyltransferase protein [Diplodia corticola]OJD33183.1 thiol methyltransferase protein [Diplodia corticola]
MDPAGDRQQRPTFPGFASQVSSASQSSSSLSTLASPSVFAVSGATSQQAQSHAGVPMPPSSPVPQSNFFGSLPPGNMAAAQAAQVQRAPQQVSRTASVDYQPNRDGAGRTAQETAAYLNEYSLVAEAAKRAQMAVLMRDMEGVELS